MHLDWMAQFETMTRDNPLLALVFAFVGGVLAGFTPCTYPMLPIIVAFTGSKAGGSRLRGFVLSSFYVLGLALVYSALGAFAALTGQLFGTLASSPWVYLAVGNICIFFGLVMLEAFSLPTPNFLSHLRVRQFAGHDIVTSILMGGVSALVVSACTTPILGVLLTVVAARQNVIWGIAMLFLFAYGLGSLVILAGTFTGLLASFPRSGIWMKSVQKFFAVLMILAGEYFLIKTGELWL
jgi:cytochrome c-type biogenesis protein